MPKRPTPATYTCVTQPNGWVRIAKFTDRSEPDSVYHLEPLADGTFACECPGLQHHGYCRHQRILAAFTEANAINTGAVFNYDTASFTRPPMYSDAEDARAIDVLAKG
jgi:hypothetical protein